MFTQIDQLEERSSAGFASGMALVRVLFGIPVLASSAAGDDPAPIKSESPGEADASVSAKPKVLVVDDNENAVFVMSMFFELEGHEVETALDGAAAVQKAASFEPDIVILDIGMPVMDGNEAAREIRKLPNGADIVLVALTGWGREKDREKTTESGFQYHLVKPVEPNILRELLEEIETSTPSS